MDYKELINRSRNLNRRWGAYSNQELSRALQDVTDVLEKTMEEWDAAMIDLRRMGCQVCKHLGNDSLNSPCRTCGDADNNWEWRGPQKEGGA